MEITGEMGDHLKKGIALVCPPLWHVLLIRPLNVEVLGFHKLATFYRCMQSKLENSQLIR
jgi:hypothetical protein